VELQQPNFTTLIRQFLHHQCHPDADSDSADVSLNKLLRFHEKISLHSSAVATFYAPSDISGIGGMCRECIRTMPTWRKGGSQYDCVFINTDSSSQGMRSLDVAHVQ
jgi:hypothetical protein